MHRRFACLLAVYCTGTHAQIEASAAPQQVVISGAQTDLEASQDFVAGKIIIGQKKIADSGLQNTGELLRREPAISVDKSGRIGLLGLPGYTQVLVDGQAPAGDTMNIDLMRVERIEIAKTTTAATGPFGIAGTINIVLRKKQRKTSSRLHGNVRTEGGKKGMDLTWTTTGVTDGSFSHTFTLSRWRRLSTAHSEYVQTSERPGRGAVREYDGQAHIPGLFESLNANSVLAWTLDASHTLTFSPEIARYSSDNHSDEQRRWMSGLSASANQASKTPTNNLYLPLLWNWKIDPDSSLALKLVASGSRSESRLRRDEVWSPGGPRQRVHEQDRSTRNYFLDLDYALDTEDGHRISAGAKFARNESDSSYTDLVDGRPDPSLAVLGPETASHLTSARLFIQDEWRINRRWAVNLGASGERRRYRLVEGPASSRPRFKLWSPSAHVSHRIGGNRKRQLRASLARSYRTPFFDEMLLRPTINPYAPCPALGFCGANGIDLADSSGNPALRPERSLGLNLSYAHGFGRDSEVSLEVYTRDISDKNGLDVALVDVPWASVPRYVIRQANLGQARVRGLDLEARLAGKDFSPTLANLELSGSIGLADSTLSELPGPDNHIPGQSPWRAKLGGSYSLQSLPVKLGFDASYLPEDWVRSSARQRVYESSRRTLNLNASWNASKTAILRLNLDNLLHHRASRIDEYLEQGSLLRLSTWNTHHARVVVRFETSL
ncbi:TonB-dependent receptor plug domain-containing protein [Massilia varians]|uniref:TonB-dependent receptor plug domain-containing protein n=1 Tax=Massilia varians TaxID=457921 RepID=UPI002555E74E|nr:TonB-dependent receptor [Massilia varians]MDK6078273.1 TonB-dependent receptor [Massilia varians]